MKNKHPFDCKRRGEWAEAWFCAAALHHDLRIARMLGASDPIDHIVVSGPKMSRVQVKRTTVVKRRAYRVAVHHRHGLYRSADVDFIAVLIIPTSTWYIIPVAEIKALVIPLYPHLLCGGPFEKFREAWHLLQ